MMGWKRIGAGDLKDLCRGHRQLHCLQLVLAMFVVSANHTMEDVFAYFSGRSERFPERKLAGCAVVLSQWLCRIYIALVLIWAKSAPQVFLK